LIKNLKYAVYLSADKWQQKGHDDEVELFYAYLDYRFLDEFAVRVGKADLPYSRISLSSSSRQLLIERPAFTEAAKKVFDEFEQPNLLLHGQFLEGILAYNLAYGDGWEEGKTLRAGNTVHTAGPLFVGRIELSPPGWIEEKKSDAYLGIGRHLTLGAHYAIQDSIEYRENTFRKTGISSVSIFQAIGRELRHSSSTTSGRRTSPIQQNGTESRRGGTSRRGISLRRENQPGAHLTV